MSLLGGTPGECVYAPLRWEASSAPAAMLTSHSVQLCRLTDSVKTPLTLRSHSDTPRYVTMQDSGNTANSHEKVFHERSATPDNIL